jgi:hypothetical protein
MADAGGAAVIEEGLDGREVLFRSVRPDEVTAEGSGKWRLSSTAFNDGGRKPSVDRAAIHPNPIEAKKNATDGIVELLTEEVRKDRIIINADAPAHRQRIYIVNVFAREIRAGNPQGLPENLAHAQIESAPAFQTDSHFKKLKERLCRLAETRPFRIAPAGVAL